MITYEDFQKLDLRIGKVVKAEKVPETDRLLKLEVDFSSEKRQIVSGIAEVVSTEEIIGREFPFILNLEPKTIKGIESQGMILAADENGSPVLIEPRKIIEPGSVVK